MGKVVESPKQDVAVANPLDWTVEEEATFATIMRIARGQLKRIEAIQLFRRCKSNHAKAVKLAKDNCGLTDAQVAGCERSKAARLAGLARYNASRSQNGRSIRAERFA